MEIKDLDVIAAPWNSRATEPRPLGSVFAGRRLWRLGWFGGFVFAAKNYRGDLALHGDFSPAYDRAVIAWFAPSPAPGL
jgi:hypothetical protein